MNTAYSYKYYGYHVAPQDGRPRRLNVGLLVVTVLLLAALGTGLYFWHRHQLRRLAVVLLHRATAAEERAEWGEASRLLFQFLRVQDSPEVIARLARDYDRAGADRDSVTAWYYRAIGRATNSSEVELRERLAELLVEAGQYTQASDQAGQILRDHPQQAAAEKWLALALHGEYRRGAPIALGEVLQALDSARVKLPADVDLAEASAHIYRSEYAATDDFDPTQAADQIMDALVAAAPDDPEAWFARYDYRRQFGVEGAEDDLQRVLELAPDGLAGLAASAELALHHGDWLTARDRLTRLATALPSPETFLKLGEAVGQLEGPNAAIELWQAAHERYRDDFGLISRLIESRITARQFPAARELLQSAENLQRRLASTGKEASRTRIQAGLMLLWGRWHLAQGQPHSALPYLYQAAAAGASLADGSPAASIEFVALRLLGQTCGDLGQWEQAAVSYERALELRPNDSATLLAAGDAWFRAGNTAKAILRGQQLVQLPGAPDEGWLLLAEAELDRQAQLPFADRQWGSYRLAIDQARRRLPESWQLQLLEVDYRLLQREPPDLPQLLSLLAGMQISPARDPQMWLGLSLAYQMLGQSEEAARALEHYLKESMPAPQAWIAQADLAVLRGSFDAARKILDAAAVTVAGQAAQTGLELARVRLRMAASPDRTAEVLQDATEKFPQREEWWDLLLEHQFVASPHDQFPSSLERLGQSREASLFAKPLSDYYRALAGLRELDSGETPPQAGEGTSRSLPFAGEQWPDAESADRDDLAGAADDREAAYQSNPRLAAIERAARQLLTDRPSWWRSFDLQARIAARAGHVDEALDAWRDALQAGGNEPGVRRRMLQLLWQQGRMVDLFRLLKIWTQPPTLARYFVLGPAGLTTEKYLIESERRRLAAGEVLPDDDPFRWIWEAALTSAGNSYAAGFSAALSAHDGGDGAADAARLLQQRFPSVEPGSETDWRSTLAALLLASTFDLPVDPWLDKLTRCEFSSADERHLMLGQAAEIIGLLPQALLHYEAVDSEGPQGTLATLRYRVVTSQLQPPAPNHNAHPPADGTGSAVSEMPILDTHMTEIRLRSLAELRRGGRVDPALARQLLEGIVQDGAATSFDKALLASVYDKQGLNEDAERLYREIIAQDEAAVYLADFVDFLLRHELYDKAEGYLEKLSRQVAIGPRVLSLRGRFLVGRGQASTFEQELQPYADEGLAQRSNPDEIARHIREVAWICQQSKLSAFAKRWFEQIRGNYPQALAPYAEHLVANQATDQAVELCLDSLNSELSAETAALLARTLVYGSPSSEVMSRSVPVIEKTRQRFPQDDRLLFAIANLELKQGRVESSIQLLRQVTELNSSHYLAWNNLAALLAENPESTAEALHCIQSAIDVVGFGMPTLLDTKAVVLLRQGRNDEAAALLEQITSALLVEDPRYFFHFALAAKRLHRVHDAVQALQQADELQLSGAFLTGIERAELADMRDQIASEQPGEEQ